MTETKLEPDSEIISGSSDVVENEDKLLDSSSEEPDRVFVEMRESYSGPVMPPKLLQQIEEIIPGGADRVLQLTEKEQKHRHHITETEITTEAWQVKASLFGGLGAFVLLLGGILYCSVNGYTAGVVALGGIGAFGVVSRIVNLPTSSKKSDKRITKEHH